VLVGGASGFAGSQLARHRPRPAVPGACSGMTRGASADHHSHYKGCPNRAAKNRRTPLSPSCAVPLRDDVVDGDVDGDVLKPDFGS
jgi:hypothetical protein